MLPLSYTGYQPRLEILAYLANIRFVPSPKRSVRKGIGQNSNSVHVVYLNSPITATFLRFSSVVLQIATVSNQGVVGFSVSNDFFLIILINELLPYEQFQVG